MSQSAKDPGRADAPNKIGSEGGVAPGAPLSGRPAFDSRGITVWEWQTAPGVYTRDASTTRVQRLQLPGLSLEKTAITKRPEIEEPQINKAPCGGFNPYDHGLKTRARPDVGPSSRETAPAKRSVTRPVVLPPSRPTTLLGRLRALLGGK